MSPSTPRLIVVAGLMASGKTTLARRIADWIDAEIVSADETREELYREGASDAFVPGYSEKLYPEVLARARQLLRRGRSVVLDASFRTRARRADARRLAEREGVSFLLIECLVPLELCRERLREREAADGHPGWLAMFEAFLAIWEPIDEFLDDEHRVVDTSEPQPSLELAFGPRVLRS